jgi:hypothetical protein
LLTLKIGSDEMGLSKRAIKNKFQLHESAESAKSAGKFLARRFCRFSRFYKPYYYFEFLTKHLKRVR